MTADFGGYCDENLNNARAVMKNRGRLGLRKIAVIQEKVEPVL